MFKPGNPGAPFGIAAMGDNQRRRMAIGVPPPALVGLVAPNGAFVEVQPPPITASGSMVAPTVEVTGSDSAFASETSHIERSESPRRATVDDYATLLVPLGTSGFALAIVSDLAGAEEGAVWCAAVFLITVLAMRDQDFSELAAKLADWLRPPRD